jgi:hypothetical protein
MFGFGRKAKKLEVAVEYFKSHWVVLIRNAGQAEWRALRDPQKKIVEQDEFGDPVRTRPAIQSFESYDAADEWVSQNLSAAKRVDKRDMQATRAFLQGLDSGQTMPYHVEATAA